MKRATMTKRDLYWQKAREGHLLIYLFRSICICKPYAYQSLFTKKRTMLYCGLIWFTTGLLDSPNWVGWSGYHFQLKEMLCGVDDKVSHAYLVIRSVAALGKNNMSPVKRICVFEHSVMTNLTAYAQPFRGARDLAFCLKVPFDSLLV